MRLEFRERELVVQTKHGGSIHERCSSLYRTPYEWRKVGAFVRKTHRREVLEVLLFPARSRYGGRRVSDVELLAAGLLVGTVVAFGERTRQGARRRKRGVSNWVFGKDEIEC